LRAHWAKPRQEAACRPGAFRRRLIADTISGDALSAYRSAAVLIWTGSVAKRFRMRLGRRSGRAAKQRAGVPDASGSMAAPDVAGAACRPVPAPWSFTVYGDRRGRSW